MFFFSSSSLALFRYYFYFVLGSIFPHGRCYFFFWSDQFSINSILWFKKIHLSLCVPRRAWAHLAIITANTFYSFIFSYMEHCSRVFLSAFSFDSKEKKSKSFFLFSVSFWLGWSWSRQWIRTLLLLLYAMLHDEYEISCNASQLSILFTEWQ